MEHRELGIPWLVFSRAFGSLPVFALSSCLLFAPVNHCNYLGIFFNDNRFNFAVKEGYFWSHLYSFPCSSKLSLSIGSFRNSQDISETIKNNCQVNWSNLHLSNHSKSEKISLARFELIVVVTVHATFMTNEQRGEVSKETMVLQWWERITE